MLKLDKTEYDLNMLFSFDILKEILLKLAKSQIRLENEINDIKNTLKNKDEDLGLEEEGRGDEESYENNNMNININYSGTNQEENNYDNNNDINENENMEDKKEKAEQEENKKTEEIKENKDIKTGNVIVEENKEEKIEDEKGEKSIKDDKKETEDKKEEKIIEEKNILIKQSDITETQLKNNEKENSKNIPTTQTKTSSNTKTKTNANTNLIKSPNKNQQSPKKAGGNKSSNNNVSPDVILKIMKQLKLLQNKITDLSKSFNTEMASIKKLEIPLKFSNVDSQLSLINDKLNSLFEKNKDYDKKFEDLQVKVANFDVFSMFQDSGDGTIDATKVLVKSLEDKIFKKFELIDQRYKVESLENMKVKNNVENMIPKINQFIIQIDKINETENKFQEDLDNIKKENEENTNEIKTVINNDINNNIENLKNNIEQNLENKIADLEKKMNEIKDNKGDNFDILKLGLGNNEVNQEAIDALDKKITDLRKKMHDINNTLKLYMSNNETDSIKNELKDMKILLDKKITKDDLKELYNYHMNTSDEINDMKDQISLTYEDIRKLTKDINNIQQKIESINGNLSLLRDNPKIGNAPIIDFSKYIDQAKLTETLRPILKEMEKIYREIDSVRRDLSVFDEENKKNTKSQINKLDDDINKKINELKNVIQKKYLEKTEFNKSIKTLEVQIKSLGDEGKKDADSWLLAKRPLKCFNCASCEANIKNDYNSADYLPWKKYPKGEKIHRMGQGFSHMLQMMTSEFVKSIERNEELEINTKNNFNSISTQFNEKNNNNNMVINTTNNNDFIKNLKKNSKMKLPKVHPYSNSKLKKYKLEESLPVSDDDLNYQEVVNNKEEDEIKETSPKILKIYKKKGGKDSYDTMGPTTMRNERMNRNLDLVRKYQFLKTDKNNFDKDE